jgi:hypothetical protein
MKQYDEEANSRGMNVRPNNALPQTSLAMHDGLGSQMNAVFGGQYG